MSRSDNSVNFSSEFYSQIVDLIKTVVEAHRIEVAIMGGTQVSRERVAGPEIHIEGNFQGILGNVSNSEVSQNLQLAVTPGNLDSLRQYLRSLGVQGNDISNLEDAIKHDPKPESKDSFGQAVGEWIGEMVSKAARGLCQLPIGTAGSLLANAIWHYYGLGAV